VFFSLAPQGATAQEENLWYLMVVTNYIKLSRFMFDELKQI
jgi:hypothetical protein